MINHKSNKTKSEPALIYVYSEEKMVLLLRATVAPLVLVFTNLFPTCGENRRHSENNPLLAPQIPVYNPV